MPKSVHDMDNDIHTTQLLISNFLADSANASLDAAQSKELALHKRHLQALWRHVLRLESALSVSDGMVTLKTGDASLTLKKDGSVTLKGRTIKVEGWGSIEIKSASNITIKGAKILEN